MTLPSEIGHSLILMALMVVVNGTLVGLGLVAIRLLG